MAQRRKEVVLATKIAARKGDDAMRQIELSLKRLQTDHLDVLHIHSLTSMEDLAAIEAPDGVLKDDVEGPGTETDAIHWHHVSRGSSSPYRLRWSVTTSTAHRWRSMLREPEWRRVLEE